MSETEIVVGKVDRFDERLRIDNLREGAPVGGGEDFATLRLRSGEIYKLDKRIENFAALAEFIKDFQLRNLSLYVEADPDTHEIIRILPSRPQLVVGISKRVDGSLVVMMFLCPSKYFLRTDLPEFNQMASLLEESFRSQSDVMVTSDPNTGEIIDVREMEEGEKTCRPNLLLLAEAGDFFELFDLIIRPGAGFDYVIPEDRADLLFDQLKNQPQIPFEYTRMCCESRAHEMRRIILSYSIACSKVWKYARNFSIPTLEVNTATVQEFWGYHTAPIVSVKMNTGNTENRVFDPSLFRTHVSMVNWSSIIKETNGADNDLEVASDKIYYREPGGANSQPDPGYHKTNSQLAYHRGEFVCKLAGFGRPLPYAR